MNRKVVELFQNRSPDTICTHERVQAIASWLQAVQNRTNAEPTMMEKQWERYDRIQRLQELVQKRNERMKTWNALEVVERKMQEQPLEEWRQTWVMRLRIDYDDFNAVSEQEDIYKGQMRNVYHQVPCNETKLFELLCTTTELSLKRAEYALRCKKRDELLRVVDAKIGDQINSPSECSMQVSYTQVSWIRHNKHRERVPVQMHPQLSSSLICAQMHVAHLRSEVKKCTSSSVQWKSIFQHIVETDGTVAQIGRIFDVKDVRRMFSPVIDQRRWRFRACIFEDDSLLLVWHTLQASKDREDMPLYLHYNVLVAE